MTRVNRQRRHKSDNRKWLIGGAVAAILIVGLLLLINLNSGTPPNTLASCGSPTCGPANAPVTIEEYSDFQ
jgi:hypothetical protein